MTEFSTLFSLGQKIELSFLFFWVLLGINICYWFSLLFVLTSMVNQLGYGGVGYIWSICEGSHEEEWRHSVAPIPADKLAEITQVIEDDLELVSQDSNPPASSGELKPDVQINSEDDAAYFEKEVEKLRDQILIMFNFLAE